MTAKSVIFVALVFFGGAVYGLNTNKMRVTSVCQDTRLYMDGGIDANIESGGLNFHRTISIFRKHNLKDEYVATLPVTAETSGLNVPIETYSGPDIKLTINKNQKSTERGFGSTQGFGSTLTAQIGKEKISVAVLCRRK